MDVIIEQYGSGPESGPANNSVRLFLYRSTVAHLYKSLSWRHYPRHVVCTICTYTWVYYVYHSRQRVFIGEFDLHIHTKAQL
jgi:hypothetical protein